jgi:hypothetical protein
MDTQNIPIACDLNAIPLAQRNTHLENAHQLLQSAEAIEELADGYAFRFASEAGKLLALAEFVENERRCCPFYTFMIEVEPGNGPLWLRLTGERDTKEFVQMVFINGAKLSVAR